MKILMFSLFCIVVTNFCMEVEKVDKKEGWKKINTWEDTKQFVGCIVAFNSTSLYGLWAKGYLISSDKSIQYGYVKWFYKKKNIDMIRLAKRNTKPDNYVFNNEEIQKNPLFMRFATCEELETIEAAISSDQAQFECENKEGALFLINKYKKEKKKSDT